jgi:hypothetical protein
MAIGSTVLRAAVGKTEAQKGLLGGKAAAGGERGQGKSLLARCWA